MASRLLLIIDELILNALIGVSRGPTLMQKFRSKLRLLSLQWHLTVTKGKVLLAPVGYLACHIHQKQAQSSKTTSAIMLGLSIAVPSLFEAMYVLFCASASI